VRAGAIIPSGPVKQHTAEPVDGPLTLTVFPGADGASTVYEDDGLSFAYVTGAFRKIVATWHDTSRRLHLRLDDGAESLPGARPIAVRIAASDDRRDVAFDGREQTIQF